MAGIDLLSIPQHRFFATSGADFFLVPQPEHLQQVHLNALPMICRIIYARMTPAQFAYVLDCYSVAPR
jgi:hypothetical protein